MKIPRDVNASELIKKLKSFDYNITRQSGSHIRLTRTSPNKEHHLTIPNHNPIKLGTLNNILKDIAAELNLTKEELINRLFR